MTMKSKMLQMHCRLYFRVAIIYNAFKNSEILKGTIKFVSRIICFFMLNEFTDFRLLPNLLHYTEVYHDGEVFMGLSDGQ